MQKKNNIQSVFFGTPDFVTHVLNELAETELMPSVIITQPDRPAGRGLQPRPAPVKLWANEHGVSVLQPETLDEGFISKLKTLNSDLFIVAGYGKILPPELLSIPRLGTLNVHPSLLPKFRGPSPIETQILENAHEVGVSVILLDEETDHGPVLAQKSFSPEPWPMMRSELETLLWTEGGKLLADSIPPYMEGLLTSKEQDHAQATFTPKLSKEDGLLDLSGDGYKNYLKYCAYEGWPGTFFFIEKNGKKVRVKVTQAEFADGEFRLLRVVPEGKKETDYEDFIRGS